jgi:hypothetical protein
VGACQDGCRTERDKGLKLRVASCGSIARYKTPALTTLAVNIVNNKLWAGQPQQYFTKPLTEPLVHMTVVCCLACQHCQEQQVVGTHQMPRQQLCYRCPIDKEERLAALCTCDVCRTTQVAKFLTIPDAVQACDSAVTHVPVAVPVSCLCASCTRLTNRVALCVQVADPCRVML